MKRLGFSARNSIALAIGAFAITAPLHSQEIRPGSVVRVWSADSTLVRRQLRIGAIAGDTLLLLDGRQPFQRRLASLQRMELRVWRTPGRGGSHFAKVGAFVGAGYGLAIVLEGMANDNCSHPDGQCASDYALPILVITTSLGAALGYPVGLLARGREWRCVPRAPCNRT